MTQTYHRPDDNIPHDGSRYYPSGIPTSSDMSSIYHNVEYRDTEWKSFWVIYTETQANQLKALVGAFAPYEPFYAGPLKP
jgi:hypothetical protein